LDPNNSNQYCGCSESTIGQNCLTSNQICTAGGCSTTCAGTTTLCKGACIDKTATHVASCDTTSITCDPNYADVDGIVTNGCEVNLKTDDNNCGKKGNQCTNGRSCTNGECKCSSGLTYCKTGNNTFSCLDPYNSNQYCGCNESAVGQNCLKDNQFCTAGGCATQCAGITTLCKGACIDKSATHVASCNATSITCESNYADVDGKVTNGCEVNLKTDNDNCGSKGNKCTNGRMCTNGSCECASGLTYCKTSNSTFACVDRNTNSQYCGCSESELGNNCTNMQRICTNGKCAECPSDEVFCNDKCYSITELENDYHRASNSQEVDTCECLPGYKEPENTMSPCVPEDES
jgi:hypothetical protein